MNLSATIIWKDEVVGKVSNIMNDMWYCEGDWIPIDSDLSSTFAAIAQKLDTKAVMQNPSKGFLANMKYEDSPSEPQTVLIISLANLKLFTRIITNRATAAYIDLNLFGPWASVENSTPFEKKFENEFGLLHPLKWRSIKAIGRRTDCDDVLFEVLSGDMKYAIVHFTPSKNRKHKSQKTEYFRDWMDVYENRLLHDHNEWKNVLDH